MNCPDCDYQMSPTDLDCPRCAKFGKPAKTKDAYPFPLSASIQSAIQNGPYAGLIRWVSVIALCLFAYVLVESAMELLGPGERNRHVNVATVASKNSSISPGSPNAPADASLLKVSEQFSRKLGFCTVSGEVKNTAAEPLNSVEAVTTFLDGNGTVISSTKSLVTDDPILPGKTSSYQTIDSDNPQIKTQVTMFKFLSGSQIPSMDAPKTP